MANVLRKPPNITDVQHPNWDQDWLNYLTWGHAVMKIGWSALTTRFCAIKFIHLVDGMGDFEHKTHRAKALIDAVSRKTARVRKAPSNPESLRWG